MILYEICYEAVFSTALLEEQISDFLNTQPVYFCK